MRHKILHPAVSRFLVVCSLLLASVFTNTAHGAPNTVPDCHTPMPATTSFPSLFQKEVDATQHFTLQIRRLTPPANWYVQLGYLFISDNGTLALNPTLLAVPGAHVRFSFVNCLTGNDIAWLQAYDLLQPPPNYNPVNVDGFNLDTAMVMTPSGYGNIHTHGLHGPPTQGNTTRIAGDEVLYTITSPDLASLSQPGVAQTQAYDILIPTNQDPGLYWYHPHLHGEAQPQVFLGLTGAILVLPGNLASAAEKIHTEIAAHPDPFTHPAVFVVRDYPAPPPPPPAASATTNPAPAAPAAASAHATAEALRAPVAASTATASPRNDRRHRANYLNHTRGGTAARAFTETSATAHASPHTANPSASPALTADNPRCTLFQAPAGAGPCLPDAVSQDPASPPPDPPSLATLVTVNGQMTEQLGPDATTPQLLFAPVAPGAVDDILRVANASANTYVKLSLSPAALPSLVLSAAPVTVMPMVPLHQLHRDGAHVPQSNRTVNTILLPPGGRAEFAPAASPVSPLSLVSQYFNTGPAGDLVPPRTLVSLPANTVPGAAQALSSPDNTAVINDHSRRFAHAYEAPADTDVRRAFAFFEQDRPCATNDGACGTSFYLLDITGPVFGAGPSKTPVTEAKPFAVPMLTLNTTNPPTDVPTRDLFTGPNGTGLFKSVIPSVQVSLHGHDEIEEEWDIYNFTAEAHAFHIHQLSFRVSLACSAGFRQAQQLSPDCRGDVRTTGDENHETDLILDVINVPPAISIPNGTDPMKNLVYPSRVHLRVPFHKDITGNFFMHCHLLEHEDNGMMMGVQVWPDTPPTAAMGMSSAPPQVMPMPSRVP